MKAGATAGKVAATVVSRMERRTKTGNKMGIIGLSDPTGHYEAVLFSEGLAAIPRRARAGHRGAAAARRRSAGRRRAGAHACSAEPLDQARGQDAEGLRIFVRDAKPLDSIARRLNMPEARAAPRHGRRLQGPPAPRPVAGAARQAQALQPTATCRW